MIDRNARRTNRDKALAVAAIVAAVIALMAWQRGCHADALPAPLQGLLARLQAPGTPAWKAALIPRIRERRIGRFEAVITLYCPANSVDPLGGGPFAAWHGLRLRRGHCAVGTRVRAVPLSTILYCPEVIDCLQVAVDTGPGVNGANRLDLCEPDSNRYLALDSHNWQRRTTWVLGRVDWRDAR